MASDVKVEFHRLLYKIAQKLSHEEIDSLVTIEGLPVAFKGKPQFTVLEQMVLQGKISESKPEKLIKVLKGINRMDLADEAKDFTRTAKRSKKSNRSSELQSDEQVSRVVIAANFEVALIQANILLVQLDRLETEASQGSGRDKMIDRVRKAKKQVESAERLLSGMGNSESDSTQSPSSDEEVRPLATARPTDTIKGDTLLRKPIEETFTQTESPRDEILYEEVTDIYVAMQPRPGAVADKQSRPKPLPKPKPTVLARPSTFTPRAVRPHSTIIPDSTQLTKQPTHSYRKSDTYTRAGSEADADTHSEDYTGGSADYTGGGTGDSGFGDAASLCRVPLRPRAHTQTQRSLEARSECYETLSSVRAGYYKSLNMETVQDVSYEDPHALYVNVSRPN